MQKADKTNQQKKFVIQDLQTFDITDLSILAEHCKVSQEQPFDTFVQQLSTRILNDYYHSTRLPSKYRKYHSRKGHMPVGESISELEQLPPNVLHSIFKFSELKEISALCRTSETLKKSICDNQSFWFHYAEHNYPNTFDSLENRKYLEKLNENWKEYVKYLDEQKHKFYVLHYFTKAPRTQMRSFSGQDLGLVLIGTNYVVRDELTAREIVGKIKKGTVVPLTRADIQNLRQLDSEQDFEAQIVGGHRIEPYANLRGVDLKEENLDGANLIEADLTDAKLNRASLRSALLMLANLQGANLNGANLQYVHLDRANLTGATIVGANFYSADIRAAELARLNFQGMVLERAHFDDSNLQEANFDDAKLRSVRFVGSNLADATFNGAKIDGASFKNANLTGAKLIGAEIVATFKGANLQNADLSGAVIKRMIVATDFNGANLKGANLQNVTLNNADFRDADLRGADFRGADTRGISATGAIIDRQTQGFTLPYHEDADGKWIVD